MPDNELSDNELVEQTRMDWQLLASQARVIAMLPLEDWLAAIERSHALGPILDPTLWREANEKMDEVAEMIRAALPLKHYVIKKQKEIEAANAKAKSSNSLNSL